MVRLLKQFLGSQRGQALPIVLGLLAIGGLTIAVSLNYATTSLKGSKTVEEKTEGVYAAGAGVEYALWSVGINGTPTEQVPQQLAQNINQMVVNMSTDNQGTFTLYLGGPDAPGAKYYRLDVSSNITWVEGDRYKYEVIVTRQFDSTIHIETTGARIPVGFEYEEFSVTRSDGEAASEPDITQDGQGADLLDWRWKDWGLTRPVVDNINTEFRLTFYITGPEEPTGYYSWVLADPAIIGLVGEITGELYEITSTATRPGDGGTTAEIVADVMTQEGAIYILSWQITK